MSEEVKFGFGESGAYRGEVCGTNMANEMETIGCAGAIW